MLLVKVKMLFTKEAGGTRSVLFFLYTNQVLRQHQKERGCFPKYCSCHTKRLLMCYQTGWNVTKCRACHAKQHYNLLWRLRKGKVLQLFSLTRRCHRKTRDPRRDTWEHQNEHFVREFLQFSHFVSWVSKSSDFSSPLIYLNFQI